MKLTANAVAKVKEVMNQQNLSMQENVLIVGLMGSPCSGLNYTLQFKKNNEYDVLNSSVSTIDDLRVVSENKYTKLLDGVTIDYLTNDKESGFVFENENTSSSCCGGGCG